MRPVPRTLVRSAAVTVVAVAVAAAPAAAGLHHPDAGRPGGTVSIIGTHGRGGLPAGVPGGRHAGPRPADAAATTPAPTATPGIAPPIGDHDGRKDLRWWPYGNVLHGAFTVETREGKVVHLVAQRGVVTAATDTSVTVTSSDGFVVTWTVTGTTRLVPVHRHGVPRVLTAGSVVGVWGPGTDADATATFVLVAPARRGAPGDGSTPTTSPTTDPATPGANPSDGTPSGAGPTGGPTGTA